MAEGGETNNQPFALSDEQRAIGEMARAFARERLAPDALDWDERKHFPVEVIRETAPLGMGAIFVPEVLGGSGLSRLDGVVIFEALSEGCPAVAAYLSIHNMVAAMIARFGDAGQQARWLPKLAATDCLSSYCLTEPSAGSDAAALRTRAVPCDGGYRLTGVKQFISGAGASGLYVVMARSGGEGARGISAFLIEEGSEGLSFGANERKMGWNAQPTRQVILEDCFVPAENRLGAEGEGFKIAMSALDGGRLNIAACSLGGAQNALDRSLAYLAERKAFGQTLQNFQALQFRLADMATELEAGRSILWRAAAALDAGDPRAGTLAAMAKRFCTDAGFEIANQAVQLHGGYGYLADYGVEKILRDLRVHQILEGTNEIMRLIIARQLLAG